MLRTTRHTLARFLAVLAVALQSFLPGALAVAEVRGVDVSHYVCSPSGQLSEKVRSSAERLAKILEDKLPDESSRDQHCSLCVLLHSVMPEEPESITPFYRYAIRQDIAAFEPGQVRRAQGPPLGSRGPPTLV